ncbi:lactoylglutathione lyase [Rhodosalinus sediminis]|jgi:lactoylglutathione lyase|uniref:Lactoylglutathione lyase n=1 Tax=Rhodosalinus sediminis TaxID=1940533 RepID=A0A3D9BNR2_9RHOB|nr:VOC family protein [Rhodosalinus sediminis]REC55154.1 lactoylglutathione lyase [Rhodosalinus sediminis]
MARLAHSMIRVLDEARSIDFYRRAFGLEVADRLDFDDFTLVYLSNAEAAFELELTVNKGREAAYDLGDGYGHLAVTVDDLDAEHARFTEAGFAPRRIVDFAPGGTRIARFFFVADPDGYQIEVLERSGRFA